MKIKGKSLFIKVKVFFIAFIVAVAAALPLRIYQYFSVIAPGTGFYKAINWSVYALYIIVGVFSLFSIILTFLSSEAVESKMPEGKNKLTGIVALVYAACFIVDTITKISSFAVSYLGYFSGSIRVGTWNYLNANDHIPIILQAVFALFSAIYFIVFGLSYISGRNTFRDSKLLALNPMLWAVARMISLLMKPISYVKVSELLFELFAMTFLMLTFLSFARVSSQLSEKGEMRKVFAFGLPAALFCLICSVPRFVLFVIGQSSRLADEYGVEIMLFSTAAFILVYIGMSMYMGNREVPEEIEEMLENEVIDDDFLSE